MGDKETAPKSQGGAGMTADAAKNWEQRLKTEYEAPHKWNEAWGELFNRGIPGEYKEKIEYLKDELKRQPETKCTYAPGEAFKELSLLSYKRTKFGYYDPLEEEQADLQANAAAAKKS